MELRVTVPMAGALAELFPPESPISHYVLDGPLSDFNSENSILGGLIRTRGRSSAFERC